MGNYEQKRFEKLAGTRIVGKKSVGLGTSMFLYRFFTDSIFGILFTVVLRIKQVIL